MGDGTKRTSLGSFLSIAGSVQAGKLIVPKRPRLRVCHTEHDPTPSPPRVMFCHNTNIHFLLSSQFRKKHPRARPTHVVLEEAQNWSPRPPHVFARPPHTSHFCTKIGPTIMLTTPISNNLFHNSFAESYTLFVWFCLNTKTRRQTSRGSSSSSSNVTTKHPFPAKVSSLKITCGVDEPFFAVESFFAVEASLAP